MQLSPASYSSADFKTVNADKVIYIFYRHLILLNNYSAEITVSYLVLFQNRNSFFPIPRALSINLTQQSVKFSLTLILQQTLVFRHRSTQPCNVYKHFSSFLYSSGKKMRVYANKFNIITDNCALLTNAGRTVL